MVIDRVEIGWSGNFVSTTTSQHFFPRHTTLVTGPNIHASVI
jgi:hypothetical protein